MKKLFAMLLALTMTFQLITPAWADAAAEEPEEVTEASEVVEEVEETEEDVPEEETTEPTEEEPDEETTEATEEELPKEPTEAPAEETEEPAVEEFPEEEEPILEEAPEEEFSLQSDEGTLASGTCGENVSWVLTSDGTLTISGSGKMADYNTSSNTAPWYKNRTSVVSVVVKSGVTSLSSYAFYGCYKLASAILEAGVETVGSYAFQDCKKLTGVMLSDGLKEIGYDAFSGCTGLTDMTIPEGVTKLGSSAFYNCSSLTSVNIPAAVTSIGGSTFYNCSSLTGVTIPVGVTSIGYSAFSGCRNLTSVTIPDSVTSIESSAFSGCSSLTSVNIPDRVTSIENSVFSGCGSLTSVNIPAGVTSIGSSAFSGCSGLTSVAIPDGVTSIGSSAFSGCSGLTSVTVPEGVTSIGYSAFSDCSSLTSVTIPESITNIEESTFYKCSGLTSVTIPENVTSIESGAFSGCSSLTSVAIPKGVTSIKSYTFYNCSSLTSVAIPEGVTDIEQDAFESCGSLVCVAIPKSVTSIWGWAFNGCSKLKDVYYGGTKDDWEIISIPGSNEPLLQATIHYQAAAASQIRPVDTDSLEGGKTLKLTLWSPMLNKQLSAKWSLAKGNEAYAAIDSDGMLTANAVTAPVQITVKAEPVTGEDGVEKNFWILPSTAGLDTLASGTCGKSASWVLTSDGTLTISGSGEMGYYSSSNTAPWYNYREKIVKVVVFGVVNVSSGVFSGCEELVSATLLSGVRTIGSYAFQDCKKLTSVNFSDGLKKIEYSAFSGCSGLINVTIPNSVTSIGESAFSGCSGLISVTIPNSVTSIGSSAFSGCSGLTGVTIPNSVTSIGSSAFSGCSGLTSVAIPDGVTSIGSSAFSGCSGLTSVTVPEGVTSIGYSAFSGCSSLTSVTIPESITNIEESTFYKCSSLTSVTIPDSVTSIAKSAFYNCSSLTSVTIPESVTSIGQDAFESCSSLASVIIPGSVTSIEWGTFRSCGNLISVTIPKSVKNIDGYAFRSCYRLKDIYYSGAKADWESISIADGNEPLQQAMIHYQAAAASQIRPLAIDSLESGKTLKLTLWSPMQNKQLSAKWSLAKGNEAYATIDPDGTLTAKAVTAPVQITVKAEPVTGEDGAEKALWILPSTAGLDIVASGVCGKNVNWVLTSDGTLTISGRGEMDNYGDYFDSQTAPWYDYRENIQNVLVKSGVTNIGHRAFFGCGELISATLLGGVQTVGNSAFQDCKKLTSVGLPDGLKDIYSCAFYGCSSLTSVTIPKGLTHIKYQSFYGCSSLTSVTIPEGVTGVEDQAFSNCINLTRVTLPEGVSVIESCAFYGCSKLADITLPKTVKIIGSQAFEGCSSLTSVTIPESVTSIEAHTFYDCNGLTSVTIPDSVTSIGYAAFYGCSSLTSVTIPTSVKSIKYTAFSGCSGLTRVEIPEGVTGIGGYAFYNCIGLTSVTIPNSVTSVESSAFEGCSGLTSVALSNNVTSIEKKVFYNCSSLTGVTIPKGVTSIGQSAFEGCSSLTSVTLPQGVTSIGDAAFSGCSLINLTIPEGVTSIGLSAFYNCSNLTSMTIPNSVTSIGSSAFSGCSGLASVTIPNSVTSIGSSAFFGCSSLTSIAIPNGVTSIDLTTFFGCSSLTSVTIPTSVTSIGMSAFGSCSSLTSVTIPASVTSIGDDAFCLCFNLKDVYYGGKKADWDKISIGEDNEILLHATLHYKGQSLPEIRPVDAAALDGGATLKLTLWSTEQNKKINAAWSLAEGDEAYATVTKDGTLTAKAVVKPVNITVIAQPTNGEPRVTKTIRINPKATALLLMLDEETLGATLDMDMYDRSVLPLAAIKNTGEEAAGIRWTTSAKTVAQVDANGAVTLLKPGTAVIQATDNGKLTGKVTLNVTYTDKSPRLEARTLTLNTALFGGVTVDFVEAYENGVEQLQWNDERFVFEYQENQLTVSAKNALKNGSYAVTLCVTCADEREYTYPLTIKVTNTLPKVTVKQTAKLNLFYRDSTAPLVISAPGQSIEEVELTDTADFALMSDGENWEITYITENAKPDTKGTLNVHLEGYREPVKVALTVGTVSTAPAVKLSATSSTLNTALNSDLTTQVVLLDKAGKPLELENPTVECDNADVKVNGNRLTITLNEAKSSTVTMYLQDSTWAKSVKLTHKITVSENLPTLKPAGNLTLNSLFAKGTAETGLVLSQSNLTLVNVEAVPAAKEGTPALAESEKLRITYAPESGHMVASIQDADNAPKAGTYSFNCTGTLEDGTTIPGGTLKVTVSATAPKVKLSATSVKLNKFLEGKEQGTVTVTAPNGYRVVDFEEMPEGMSYDKDTGILTVTLENASDNGGNYTLYPVVQNVETGEEVELPTKLSFKVQAYNSQKLSVSLSAKGKLDTQKDGEITYTVTKLANCLGTVEDMDLEGQDAALFRAEMDIVNGKPTVHLTLKDGETYATNKAYKVQFRFYACGREILSPVQTVKVTQTALKVTAPKTITYYQAQKSPLRVVLTTNVPLDEVVLNDKTAKEFQAAVGEVTLNGNRVEFEITNPSALTAGKSYSVILDATPENNASNVKSTTVKLTVKVQK